MHLHVITVYLPKKVLENIRNLNGLRLSSGVGSGLVLSYCTNNNKYIVCTYMQNRRVK